MKRVLAVLLIAAAVFGGAVAGRASASSPTYAYQFGDEIITVSDGGACLDISSAPYLEPDESFDYFMCQGQ